MISGHGVGGHGADGATTVSVQATYRLGEEGGSKRHQDSAPVTPANPFERFVSNRPEYAPRRVLASVDETRQPVDEIVIHKRGVGEARIDNQGNVDKDLGFLL